MQVFANAIAGELPDKTVFKEMGLQNIDIQKVYKQVIVCFNLTNPLE